MMNYNDDVRKHIMSYLTVSFLYSMGFLNGMLNQEIDNEISLSHEIQQIENRNFCTPDWYNEINFITCGCITITS